MRIGKWLKQADFNHDGKVGDEDFIVMRNNFGKQTEGIIMKAPSVAKAAASGSNIELSFELDGVDINRLHAGDIIYAKVRIRNAADLLGAEVHLSFDPKVLEVVNVPVPQNVKMNALRSSASAIGIGHGDYFTTAVWELANRVDNAAGRIDYSVGVLKPEINDKGILAIVPFRIKAAGVSTDISFDFKEQDNRQTFFVERRYAAGEKPITAIPDVRSEGISIDVLPVIDPTDICVYPNPVDASKSNEVIFASLPAGRQVTLKIYNLVGELIIEKGGTGEIRWGLQNQDNTPVASGIYIFSLLDGARVIKQGKIGVVR
jgi:hypothetical protein